MSSFSVKDTIDFLRILLYLLLLCPCVPQRLGHLMALVSGQLGLLGRHLQVVINQLLANADLFSAAVLTLSIVPVDLHVERSFDLIFCFFGLGALFDASCGRLNGPERVRIAHVLGFFCDCVSLVPLFNLYLPYLIALLLHRSFSLQLSSFLHLIFNYLIMEFLLLTDQ